MYEEVIRALDDSESKIIVSYGCKNFRFYDKPFIKKCLQEAFRENIEVEVVEHLKARSREIVWNPY